MSRQVKIEDIGTQLDWQRFVRAARAVVRAGVFLPTERPATTAEMTLILSAAAEWGDALTPMSESLPREWPALRGHVYGNFTDMVCVGADPYGYSGGGLAPGPTPTAKIGDCEHWVDLSGGKITVTGPRAAEALAAADRDDPLAAGASLGRRGGYGGWDGYPDAQAAWWHRAARSPRYQDREVVADRGLLSAPQPTPDFDGIRAAGGRLIPAPGLPGGLGLSLPGCQTRTCVQLAPPAPALMGATCTPLPAAESGHRWVGPLTGSPRWSHSHLDPARRTELPDGAPVLLGGLVPVTRDGLTFASVGGRRMHPDPEGWYVQVPGRVSCLAQEIWWDAGGAPGGRDAIAGLRDEERRSRLDAVFCAAVDAHQAAERAAMEATD